MSSTPDAAERPGSDTPAATAWFITAEALSSQPSSRSSTAAYHLKAMERRGIVTHTPRHSRSYQVCE